MRVLVACEFSGTVRDAFRRKGHEAWSCDLLSCEADPTYHYQCDVIEVINDKWDLMIAHPPCTYLSVSGLHWNKRRPERALKTEEALDFVRFLLEAPIPFICVENPKSCISTRIRKPDQKVQPYQFGHDASKETWLWLKDLPQLYLPPRSEWVQPRMVDGKPRWGNQTDGGQNRLGPSADRWKERSKTYQGIAEAMAEQWSYNENT